MTITKVPQEQLRGEELQAAQKTIQAFNAAFKSYSLYPEDHIFCRTNLEKFITQLESFLELYEEFSLDIAKNSFFYGGKLISEGSPEEANPAYLLTRDGLIRLNFLRGLDSAEITALFQILGQHRSAGDESGGDIVTSFWQAEFRHIEYEEVDIFALELFNFDLDSLKAAPDEIPPRPAMIEMPAGKQQADTHQHVPRTIAEKIETEVDSEQNPSLAQSETVTNLLRMDQTLKVLEITPEEQLLLRSYVEEEEKKDYTNDIIDVLLIILVSQKNKLHFRQVLLFLEDVFFACLRKGDFHLASKLCGNVLTIRDQMQAIRPWTLELVDNFFSSLSAQERWAELPWVKNPHLLVVLHKEYQKFLWHVLRLLTPEIIFTLGPLMRDIDMNNIDVRNELFALIESNAKKDPDKLDTLLAGADASINLLLFPIIAHLGPKAAAKISLRMTRHDSVEVRRTGLNGYFSYTSSPDFDALFPLLNDGDDVIVGRLLTFLLSRAEAGEAETLLLRFLEQAIAEGVEHPHMFEYYKALSQCGSFRSIQLLKQILLESKVTEMFSNMNAVHKKGSALALKILGTEEALTVLRDGLKSMRPDIRLACQFALGKAK